MDINLTNSKEAAKYFFRTLKWKQIFKDVQ